MIVLLSPSKTLDMSPHTPPLPTRPPAFAEDAQSLAGLLRSMKVEELQTLMKLSDKLAQLNHDRYREFAPEFREPVSKAAIYAFKGDVYEPLTLASYSEDDLAFADRHIRILSGLYGLLRPLDLMQAYRLEMGTPLRNPRGKDLYAYWGDRITQAINAALREEDDKLVINLASQEYYKAVQPGRLEGTPIDICFLDQKPGQAPKVVGLFAKQARGLMADFIVRQRVMHLDALKVFNDNNYRFHPPLSDEKTLAFLRKH